MYLAYNTNGFAHHRLDEALRVLADLGYRGVALTPDVPHLDLARVTPAEVAGLRATLERLRLRCVIETGARFTLDPWHKHWPSLLTPDEDAAQRRLEDYHRCLELARDLGAEVMSLWSGGLRGDEKAARADSWQRLTERLCRVLDRAGELGVCVALEPEPGMFIASLTDYRELRRRLGRDDLATTLDIGHLLVTEPGEPQDHLAEFATSLRHVQLDDMRRGVHEHLALGEGEVDVAAVMAELRRLGFEGAVALELSRDSHRAVEVARAAYRHLEGLR